MKQSGDIALVQFPFADMAETKLRPVLLIGQPPGAYGDWHICMISSRTPQQVQGFDELIAANDQDFRDSGLKVTSVVRVGRLLTVEESLLLAQLGKISPERLRRIRTRLGEWLLKT